jgi:hypothetical protein
MTSSTVHRCAHPDCRRLCIGWLCRPHSAQQPEVAPEHHPHAERRGCVDLASPGHAAGAIPPGAACSTSDEVLQGNHSAPLARTAQPVPG